MMKHGTSEVQRDDDTSKKHQCSDLKRLEAIKSRQNETRQRQAAIKQALSKIDSAVTTVNKKIVFSDESFQGNDLFPEDDDDNDNEFNIAPQYEGKKGHELLKLQGRFGNDQRFRLDTRFAESDDDDDQSEVEEQPGELKANMEALNKVLYIPKTPSYVKQQMFKDTGSLRYDPAKEDAHKFKRVEKVKTDKESVEALAQEVAPEVTTERFFQVSSDLQEAITQQNGETFSLLKMFSSQPQLSSDEEEETEKIPQSANNLQSNSTPRIINDNKAKFKPHPKAFIGSRFFIYPGDYRLKEGINFFCRQKNMDDVRDHWMKGRDNVQRIYQLKNRRNENKKWKKPRKKFKKC